MIDTLSQYARGMSGTYRELLFILGLFAIAPIITTPFLAGQILVFAVFALGYNLLLGYGGELSFGHAAFIGVGAYGTILAMEHLQVGLVTAMVLGILLTALFSLVVGVVSLQRRGLYFAMITLALAQAVYFLAFQLSDLTGGRGGTTLPATEFFIGPVNLLDRGVGFYLFGLVTLIVVWAVVRRLLNSPYGKALQAIRENEQRAEHLGYRVQHHLVIAFVLSGTISGLAGSLYAVLHSFINPQLLFWSTSGDIVLITLIGGVGTILGPIIGAFIFFVLDELLTKYVGHAPLFFGLIMIFIVLYSSQGIYGLYKGNRMDWYQWVRDRLRI